MVKSSAAEMSALRQEVFERDWWHCRWPGCRIGDETFPTEITPLQMAHLTHRGVGGSKYANRPENCVTLCSVHHDCLDGRTALGTLRFELNELLRFVVGSVEP